MTYRRRAWGEKRKQKKGTYYGKIGASNNQVRDLRITWDKNHLAHWGMRKRQAVLYSSWLAVECRIPSLCERFAVEYPRMKATPDRGLPKHYIQKIVSKKYLGHLGRGLRPNGKSRKIPMDKGSQEKEGMDGKAKECSKQASKASIIQMVTANPRIIKDTVQ